MQTEATGVGLSDRPVEATGIGLSDRPVEATGMGLSDSPGAATGSAAPSAATAGRPVRVMTGTVDALCGLR